MINRTSNRITGGKSLDKYSKQIPNALTILRMALALTFPFLSNSARPAILFAALLSDYLDGTLARTYFWKTKLGQILDPMADKFFFGAVAFTFLFENRITFLEILALGFRDVAVFFGTLWLAVHGNWKQFLYLKPKRYGKITTALQYITLIIIALNMPWRAPFLYTTLAFGAVAAIQYTILYYRSGSYKSPLSEKKSAA